MDSATPHASTYPLLIASVAEFGAKSLRTLFQYPVRLSIHAPLNPLFGPVDRVRVGMANTWFRTGNAFERAEDAVQRIVVFRRRNKYIRLPVLRVTSEELDVNFITLVR